MPAGWMHAVIDLIAYDRPYLEIHQLKDAPARWLGVHHRAERHDWYNAGKAGIWSLENPTPPWIDDAIRAIGEAHGDEAAEQHMGNTCASARDAHRHCPMVRCDIRISAACVWRSTQ